MSGFDEMSAVPDCGGDHAASGATGFSVVGCAQVPALLAKAETLLLDCRKLPDYRAGHIEGALHVHDGLIESLLTSGDRARPLVIYCYHGHTSEHLAEAFANAGFHSVFSVSGGYDAWCDARCDG